MNLKVASVETKAKVTTAIVNAVINFGGGLLISEGIAVLMTRRDVAVFHAVMVTKRDGVSGLASVPQTGDSRSKVPVCDGSVSFACISAFISPSLVSCNTRCMTKRHLSI